MTGCDCAKSTLLAHLAIESNGLARSSRFDLAVSRWVKFANLSGHSIVKIASQQFLLYTEVNWLCIPKWIRDLGIWQSRRRRFEAAKRRCCGYLHKSRELLFYKRSRLTWISWAMEAASKMRMPAQPKTNFWIHLCIYLFSIFVGLQYIWFA